MNSERFMVIASGTKNGQQYSSLKRVVEGKKKDTGEPYQFLDDNSFMKEAETLPLGTILRYERRRVDNKLAANKAIEQ